MNLDEFNNYMINISDLEFKERNHEISQSITRLKSEMLARGMLNSSITLLQLSEFFGSEYIARCDFIKSFIIGHASKLELMANEDLVTQAKIHFQQLCGSEKNNIEKMYDDSAAQIANTLLGDHLTQLRDSLRQRIDNSIVKNNLYIELEFKAINEAKSSGKEVLTLNPSIYGMGIDLKELWNRYFKV